MSGWVPFAAAAAIVGLLAKSRWNYLRLPELRAGGAPEHAPGLTVIIPARNEHSNIARAVGSFRGCPVIVVDDGSSDRTADLAREAGALVVPAPPLAPGSLGKPAACAEGARHARSEWLLFVDADTWFEPRFAAAALEHARGAQLDLLTCFLRNVHGSWWERVLLPYGFGLYFCGVTASAVNSPRRAESLANGQCMLFRRAAYRRIGGHDAVRQSVIEDVALAAVAKRAGLRTEVVRAEQLGAVRMYDGLPAIWRGFAKNTFRFLQANPWTGAQVMAASVLLASWIPLLVLAASQRQWWTAAMVAVAPSVGLAPWYGGWKPALAAPIAIHVFQAIALDGMFRTLFRRTTLWKGRHVG